ncbi:unnamed protein product [Toxocara canis]|uniref:Uncharacterized protein n=1 Tax=Toxocara canis TaxID=6265 RepID=A0A183TY43_TOXCA|nr:unnamed protein product [Toxocara canis]
MYGLLNAAVIRRFLIDVAAMGDTKTDVEKAERHQSHEEVAEGQQAATTASNVAAAFQPSSTTTHSSNKGSSFSSMKATSILLGGMLIGLIITVVLLGLAFGRLVNNDKFID